MSALPRRVLDALPDAVLLSDPGQRVLYLNRAALERYGVSETEAVGQPLTSLYRRRWLPPEDEEVARAALAAGGTWSGELVHVTRAGVELRVAASVVTLKDDAGNAQAYLSVVREVSPRVEGEVEQALRASEERFRKVYENAPMGIAITCWDGQFQQCNAAYSALLGYSAEELHRVHFASLVHPEDRPHNQAELGRLKAGATPYFEVENRYVHRDGRPIWVHKYVTVLRDETGRPAHLVALVTDVSARKEAEEKLLRAREELEQRVKERTHELQQRADQLSRLASDLSLAEQRARQRLSTILHDHVQQLLASAKMNVELFAKGSGDREATLGRIRRCLDEAIAASRSLSVELSPPLLHEFGLAAGLEWLAEWMAEKHALQVRLSLDAQANPDSEEVRALLFASVRELLFNTVKHARVRTADVELAVHDERCCRVTVSDCGVGFEPGAQPSARELSEGGLGLFSVRERLGLLGGSLEIASAPGAGARFTLIAPRTFRNGQPPLPSGDG